MITIKTNLPQVQKRIEKRLLSLTQTDKILRVAALTSVARVRVRVFTQGKNSSGGMIGNYSNNRQPFYWFTSKSIPKKFRAKMQKYAPKRKKSGTIYYGVKNHKQVREIVGLQTAFVDLEFTGQMRGNLVPIPGNGKTTYGFGWTNPTMAERAMFNEARYGKIFSLTQKELDEVGVIILKEVVKHLTAKL